MRPVLSAAGAGGDSGRAKLRPERPLLVIGIAATLGGLAAGLGGLKGAALALGMALGAAIYAAPPLGAFLWLATSPLIVGIERGSILPVLRPNEALLLLILGAVGLRLLPALLLGHRRWPELNRVDLALGLLLLTGSLLPVALRFGRGLQLTQDDVLYSLVLIKYLLLYAIFRCAIVTEAQVRVCLLVALGAAVPVALIALLQVNDLLGVPAFLDRYYGDPFSGTTGPVTARGTSTVASSFGVANIMIIASTVVLAWCLRDGRRNLALYIVGIVCLLGVVAAGQFSGFIGVAIAIVATGVLIGRIGRIVIYALPVLAIAASLLWPVVEQRLDGFERQSGLPQSWEGRIDNLERFILPELTADTNWLVGVRPSPQIPAPEWWRDWVYIESGYIWLLWIGGIPFLVAFLTFVWIGLNELLRVVRCRRDAIGLAAIASTAALWMIAILMAFDPHLTMRGGADLFFPLLALALVAPETFRNGAET